MKILIYLSLVIGLISCGKMEPQGEVKMQEVKIEAFEKLELYGNFQVQYLPSTENKVLVETYPNIFENLQIETKNKKLTIKEKTLTEGVDVCIITLHTTGKPSEIEMAGLAQFNGADEMMMDKIQLNMKNESKFSARILTNKAKMILADKAQVRISGKTLDTEIFTKDSVNIISPQWIVNNLNINAKGDSETEIAVAEKLEGKIENKAKLHYRGKPTKKILAEGEPVIKEITIDKK